MRKITTIILHCSDFDSTADQFNAVRQDHMENREFFDIGYHYFIEPDGTPKKGRDLDMIGAHCHNHNENSIGICLAGQTNFFEAQFMALRDLIDAIKRVLCVADIDIKLHNELDSNKLCPVFSREDAGL